MILVLKFLAVELLTLESGFQQHLEEFDLGIREFGVPDVDDKVDPRLITIMPCFVIKRIIKNNTLALLESASLIPDAH